MAYHHTLANYAHLFRLTLGRNKDEKNFCSERIGEIISSVKHSKIDSVIYLQGAYLLGG